MLQTLIKGAVQLTVSSGSAVVVGNFIKQSLPTDLKKYQKVTTAIAGLAISGMTAAAAAEYAGKQVDSLFDGVNTGWLVAQELRNRKVVKVDVDTEAVKDVFEDAADLINEGDTDEDEKK
jgi:hypothetical protein